MVLVDQLNSLLSHKDKVLYTVKMKSGQYILVNIKEEEGLEQPILICQSRTNLIKGLKALVKGIDMGRLSMAKEVGRLMDTNKAKE